MEPRGFQALKKGDLIRVSVPEGSDAEWQHEEKYKHHRVCEAPKLLKPSLDSKEERWSIVTVPVEASLSMHPSDYRAWHAND